MLLTGSTLKKTLAAALVLATVGTTIAATTTEAEARWRRGPAVAAGIIGGLAAGALIAGATRPAYGYDDGYYRPAYAPVYGAPAYVDEGYDAPVCYTRRQRVYVDDVRFVYRRVRVCE